MVYSHTADTWQPRRDPSATSITMPAVVASIGGNTVSYNAR